MVKPGITLFVGNGINYVDETAISWNDLLESISMEDTAVISETLGMTLRFEYIDAVSDENSKEIKIMVAEKTAEKSKTILRRRNSMHRQLMQLPINSIITSNYEYSLELSMDKNFLPMKSTKETLYSFYRKQHVAGKDIYHIHGECRYPNSICLGFEHYAGILEKMRGKLVKNTKSPDNVNKRFHLYDVLNGLEVPDDAWYYSFFMNDIVFLGFGFDQSEEDIWWLITYRRRLKEQYPALVQNKVIYLDTTPDSKRKKVDESKEKVLQAMDVKIEKLYGKTYLEKYKSAIAFLKDLTVMEA